MRTWLILLVLYTRQINCQSTFSLLVPGEKLPIWHRQLIRTADVLLKAPTGSLTDFTKVKADLQKSLKAINEDATVIKYKEDNSTIRLVQNLRDITNLNNQIAIQATHLQRLASSATPPPRDADESCDVPLSFPMEGDRIDRWTQQITELHKAVKTEWAAIDLKADLTEDQKKAAKIVQMENLSMLLDTAFLYLVLVRRGLKEHTLVAEQLSNIRTPEKIIYALNMANCVRINDQEDIQVVRCGTYATGFRCDLRITRLVAVGPGYKVVTIPYYSPKTDKYYEVDLPPDMIMDGSFTQHVRRELCSLHLGGYVCTDNPWERHPCLEAVEDHRKETLQDYCEMKYYHPKSVKLADTEYGALYAPRSGEDQQVEWTKAVAGVVDVEEAGPLIFTGGGSIQVIEGIAKRAYDFPIAATSTNAVASAEDMLRSSLVLDWIMPDFGPGAPGDSLWEQPEWELIQLCVAIASLLIAAGSLPCCFLVCKQKIETWQEDDEEEGTEAEAQELYTMNRVKTLPKKKKAKKDYYYKAKKKPDHQAAVKGFLAEFTPKPSAPVKETRFMEIY